MCSANVLSGRDWLTVAATRCRALVFNNHAVTLNVSMMRHAEFQTVKATRRLPPALEASSPELQTVGSISFLSATKLRIFRPLPCSSFFNKGTLHPEFVNVSVSAGVTDLTSLVKGEKMPNMLFLTFINLS
jgi:hypothetical protein